MFIFRILRRAIGGLALFALAAGIIALSACGQYVPHEPGTDDPGETPGIEQPDESTGEDTNEAVAGVVVIMETITGESGGIYIEHLYEYEAGLIDNLHITAKPESSNILLVVAAGDSIDEAQEFAAGTTLNIKYQNASVGNFTWYYVNSDGYSEIIEFSGETAKTTLPNDSGIYCAIEDIPKSGTIDFYLT